MAGVQHRFSAQSPDRAASRTPAAFGQRLSSGFGLKICLIRRAMPPPCAHKRADSKELLALFRLLRLTADL